MAVDESGDVSGSTRYPLFTFENFPLSTTLIFAGSAVAGEPTPSRKMGVEERLKLHPSEELPPAPEEVLKTFSAVVLPAVVLAVGATAKGAVSMLHQYYHRGKMKRT